MIWFDLISPFDLQTIYLLALGEKPFLAIFKLLQEISFFCIYSFDVFVMFMCKIYDIYDVEFYFLKYLNILFLYELNSGIRLEV